VLVLCDVYPAGEAPIAGADGRALSRAVRARGLVDPVFVATVDGLNETLGHLVRGGDIVVTMGAGDIGGAAGRAARFSLRSGGPAGPRSADQRPMMAAALNETGLRGELLLDEPLSRTRAGASAAPRAASTGRRTAPTSSPSCRRSRRTSRCSGSARQQPVVRDGGFAGTVLAVSGRLNALRLSGPGRLYGEAGVACAHVARLAVRNGGVGLEFLAGIPARSAAR